MERLKLELKVMSNGQTALVSGLSMEGTTTTGRVDVTLGAGVASTTTVSGNLTVTGGDITLANGSTIDSSATNGILLLTEDVVQKGHWNRNEYINHDLKGNSLGIIGYGRIGKIISNYAKAFDMKIFVYEKNVKKRISSKFIKFVSLKKALSCKFITIHIPLEKNYNFLSKKILNQISKDSYVINTSRGDIFDEKGLINLIKSKSLNGFAFDVLPSDVIWKNKISKKYKFLKKMNYNFFITPHIGGNTVESRSKTTIFMIKKFLKKLTRN